MSSAERILKYSLGINEALHQCMEEDDSVILIGQGVKSPWYVGNTCNGLLERFGEKRVIDTPVSENAITGAAVGASLAGMKAIVVHPRMDFMLYGLDPIINEAANWHYMFGGKASVPVVIWGVVNRGGEQGAQHSQSLHGTFAHFPGLKVVMPTTAYDAKGLMVAAIRDPNPVVFIDDRWLYGTECDVPVQCYETEIGKASIMRPGQDITIIASSYYAHIASQAFDDLAKVGINAEIIDLRSIKPIDRKAIKNSVDKTGRALILDGGWRSFGVAAEIMAIVIEESFGALRKAPMRLTLPDVPAPASRSLEAGYYFGKNEVIQATIGLMNL